MSERLLVLPALLLAVLPALAGDVGERPGRNDIFPGARCDARETAALAGVEGRGPTVYRTRRPFDAVLNYYRFATRQSVQVSRERLGERFLGIARALEQRDPPRAVLTDPFVVRFNQQRARTAAMDGTAAARAWRAYARRVGGRVQLVGEGQRVTIYRPYLSQRTFALLDETVFLLGNPGGPCR